MGGTGPWRSVQQVCGGKIAMLIACENGLLIFIVEVLVSHFLPYADTGWRQPAGCGDKARETKSHPLAEAGGAGRGNSQGRQWRW